jgi:hypothetical protein
MDVKGIYGNTHNIGLIQKNINSRDKQATTTTESNIIMKTSYTKVVPDITNKSEPCSQSVTTKPLKTWVDAMKQAV